MNSLLIIAFTMIIKLIRVICNDLNFPNVPNVLISYIQNDKLDVPKMDQLPIIHVIRVDKYYHITSPFNNASHFMVIILVSFK